MKKPHKTRTHEQNRDHAPKLNNDKERNKEVVCVQCGALMHDGIWSWNQLPEKFTKGKCPACERIELQKPAGIITLSGDFIQKNQNQISSLVQSVASSELSRHPLERIIDKKFEKDSIQITTTGLIIARRIGYVLNLAYQGTLETSYEENGIIKIHWHCSE